MTHMYERFNKTSTNRVATNLSLFLLLTLFSFSLFATKSPPQAPTIGILQILAHPALDKSTQGVIDIVRKTYPDANIQTNIAQGNLTTAALIAQKYVSEKVDVIVTLGTTASQIAVKAAKNQKIPVVFASVTNPLDAQLVKDLKKPNATTTGVSNYTSPQKQLVYFKRLIPSLKKVGMLYNPGDANSVILVKQTRTDGQEIGLEVLDVAVTKATEVSQGVRKLMGSGAEAVFINNDNTSLAAFDVIVQICTEAKIPLFVSDTDIVPQGALAALGPDQYKLGEQAGAIILKILAGTAIADIPVEFAQDTQTYLNQPIARAIGLEIAAPVLKGIDHVILRR
jgi:putative ABC transport system substrate-binding protein